MVNNMKHDKTNMQYRDAMNNMYKSNRLLLELKQKSDKKEIAKDSNNRSIDFIINQQEETELLMPIKREDIAFNGGIIGKIYDSCRETLREYGNVHEYTTEGYLTIKLEKRIDNTELAKSLKDRINNILEKEKAKTSVSIGYSFKNPQALIPVKSVQIKVAPIFVEFDDEDEYEEIYEN